MIPVCKRVVLIVMIYALFFISYGREQTITVFDIPYSTEVSIKKIQELSWGDVTFATSGTIAVNHQGNVFVTGDVLSDDESEVVPSIFEIVFTPAVWEPDSLKGVTKSVSITVSSDSELHSFNGGSAAIFDFEDITKGRKDSVLDNKKIITLTVGGILTINHDIISDYYNGKINIRVNEF